MTTMLCNYRVDGQSIYLCRRAISRLNVGWPHVHERLFQHPPSSALQNITDSRMRGLALSN